MQILLVSAVSIGFFHTVIGIDHSLPFVVMGRARGWSLKKVLGLTFLCGLGHVLSSVVLGMAGISLGVALEKLEWIEASRGDLAAWLLIIFGFAYAGWAVARKRRAQEHAHAHDGVVHAHTHEGEPGQGDSHHHHVSSQDAASMTAWSLFIIFVLGPCEPLIPLLMVPAAKSGAWGVTIISLAFGLTTIGTMLVVVTIGYVGLQIPTSRKLEEHVDTLAGLAIASSGLAIKFFGI
jgi:sulfite exporter TauE/SafE